MIRLVISVVIVILFGVTGARVGALWQVESEPPAQGNMKVAPVQRSQVEWQPQLSEQSPALMERLNRRLQRNVNDFEASLLKGLLLFQSGALNDAISELRELTSRAPKFQLAHLVLGDLLTARFAPLDAIGSSAIEGGQRAERDRVVQLQNEARARLLGYLSLADERRVPAALMSLGHRTDYALVVDKGKNRLYVFKNTGPGQPPKAVEDFYIVLGKKTGDKEYEGDLKTPNGVYFITSYLPDEKLPPSMVEGLSLSITLTSSTDGLKKQAAASGSMGQTGSFTVAHHLTVKVVSC